MTTSTGKINVYARWRPLTEAQTTLGETRRSTKPVTDSLLSLTVTPERTSTVVRPWPGAPVITSSRVRSWTSGPAFTSIIDPKDDNEEAYDRIVAPAIPGVMQGGTSSFFAYGHSGSGKTHTIMGGHDGQQLGLCLMAAKQLFEEIRPLNQKGAEACDSLGVGFRLFELRKKSAFDLLNDRAECYIREGRDGKTHFRATTQALKGGNVRVSPIIQRACWTFESLKDELLEALAKREVKSSSVHDESSRTHAVLELEIINRELADARGALLDRQAELVPVAKRVDEIEYEENEKQMVLQPSGLRVRDYNIRIDYERIREARLKTVPFKQRITAAEEHLNHVLLYGHNDKCLGARMIFVDLAGAEYVGGKASLTYSPKQTPQERHEGRQINTDLLALKQVIRAWSTDQPRIPFRASPLTMVLRECFQTSENTTTAMIVTASPATEQYAATLNSLKFGSLVGSSGV